MKVGDVFYACWGYEQTNIDYVKIVSISPSGKTVKAVKIGKIQVDRQTVMPAITRIQSEPFQLKIVGDMLRGSYVFIETRADEPDWMKRQNKRFDTLFRYTEPNYETPFGEGH